MARHDKILFDKLHLCDGKAWSPRLKLPTYFS
jgi:hypothetical protein